jgi:type II secretory pathway pseudopilin PulG
VSKKAKGNKQQGFVLIETLIAAGILAVGLIAVFTGFSRGARILKVTQEQEEALSLIESVIFESEHTGKTPNNGENAQFAYYLESPQWETVETDQLDPKGKRKDISLLWGPPTKRQRLTVPVFE